MNPHHITTVIAAAVVYVFAGSTTPATAAQVSCGGVSYTLTSASDQACFSGNDTAELMK